MTIKVIMQSGILIEWDQLVGSKFDVSKIETWSLIIAKDLTTKEEAIKTKKVFKISIELVFCKSYITN